MASSGRDEFTKAVQELLAKRAGFKCSAPFCRATTVGPGADPAKSVSIGVAAHITAASEGGPRYDKSLTNAQRCELSNGIWLCQTHAREIDVDPARYPADLLRQWRDDAETAAQNAVGKPEHHVGEANTVRAKQALVRASRVPDFLIALIEEILALPNATIENIYPGKENELGRKEAARKHSQTIREVRREAEDALPIVGISDLTELISKLFTLEATVRGQIQSARVPREHQITTTPEWHQLEQLAGEIRRRCA